MDLPNPETTPIAFCKPGHHGHGPAKYGERCIVIYADGHVEQLSGQKFDTYSSILKATGVVDQYGQLSQAWRSTPRETQEYIRGLMNK